MRALLDDRAGPPLREVIGRLLVTADTADIAVANVRLHAIDLSPVETRGLRRCRILLGRLHFDELASLAGDADGRARRLAVLRAFLTSGRVEIRSAGIGSWLPDFSVYAGPACVCVVGAHYFHESPVANGPAFTCVIAEEPAVARAAARFEELWQHAHDVTAVVIGAIDEARSALEAG